MTTRTDRDIDARREERVGWAERQGNIGRIQSREDLDEFKPRDWRDADRFYARDEDEDEDDRGWFGRVRDTASRWLRGRDDEDERDDERDSQRRNQGGERTQHLGSRAERSWQDDDNQGRFRGREDNRRRQFAGYEPDEDDRSGQFNRLHEDRGTLGRRGEAGLTGRTDYDRYDERGRFSHLGGDEERGRYYGEQTRYRPFGDERNMYERQRQFGGEGHYGRGEGRRFGGEEYGGEGRRFGGEYREGREYGGERQRFGGGEHGEGRRFRGGEHGEGREYGAERQRFGGGEHGEGREYGRERQRFGGGEYGEGREYGRERQRFGGGEWGGEYGEGRRFHGGEHGERRGHTGESRRFGEERFGERRGHGEGPRFGERREYEQARHIREGRFGERRSDEGREYGEGRRFGEQRFGEGRFGEGRDYRRGGREHEHEGREHDREIRRFAGSEHERDESGRYLPGRQEHVEHDDRMRRGISRFSDRDSRR